MIATRETLSTNWTNAMLAEQANIESGISKARAKAMVKPESLDLEEPVDLDSYFLAFMYDYHHNYLALDLNGSPELIDGLLGELEDDASIVFGSRFARAWYMENRRWIHTEITTVIDRGLKDAPIGEDLDYYRRLQAMAMTLE